jgi:hypothetical protein
MMDINRENQNRGNKRSRQKQQDETRVHLDTTTLTIYIDSPGIEDKFGQKHTTQRQMKKVVNI